jgi:hypothetical protein
MVVGRLLLEVVVEFRCVSTGSGGAVKSLDVPDVVEIAVSLETLGDVDVTGSLEAIGFVLLIVTVTMEGSVESVGETVITDVLAPVACGADSSSELEEIALVEVSLVEVSLDEVSLDEVSLNEVSLVEVALVEVALIVRSSIIF